MAEVWRGKQEGAGQFQRLVAIKKILSHISEDDEFRKMFADEANITVALHHPNIGQVQEFNHIDNTYYIAMEYISGKDLKHLWKAFSQKKTVVPVELACFIVQKMAEGLDYAHTKVDNMGKPLGIVHRDVSPQNVLLSWEGEVKVIDFGIAKANEKQSSTKVGTLKGKFAYMSPEQIRGLPLDGRADIFAIGVVLYELLTGQRAFTAESEFSLLEKVRQVELKPPTMVNADIPPELERIVFKALEKDRKVRYQRARDLAEDLQRYLLQQGRPPGAPELGEFLRNNFAVDHDKERLRLMKFENLTLPEPGAPLPGDIKTEADLLATQSGDQAPRLDAIRTMLANERALSGTSGESSAFSSSADLKTKPIQRPDMSGGMSAGERAVAAAMGNETPVTAIRPANDALPVQPQVPATQPLPLPPAPASSGGAFKWVALTTLVLLALAGAAFYAFINGFIGGGSVLVQVEGPSKAFVRIDGELVGSAAPSITASRVRSGKRTIVVEAPAFKPFVREIELEAGSLKRIDVKMKRVQARLRVTSEPDGASIFIDGKDSGQKTPHTFEDLESGVAKSITLKNSQYMNAKKDVQLSPTKENALHLVLEPSIIQLNVRSEPSKAKVRIGDEDVGVTPFVLNVNKKEGAPLLKFKHRGCKSAQMQVSFTGKKSQVVKSVMTCW